MKNLLPVIIMSDIRDKKRKAAHQNYLDAQASYVLLDECLKFLNMNSMAELEPVKKEIKLAMEKMKEVEINGRR